MTSPKNWYLPRPSVFTPFLRRFTDERARDIKETKKLYETVTSRHRASVFSREEADLDVAQVIVSELENPIPEQLQFSLFDVLVEVLRLEKPIFQTLEPDLDLGKLSLNELVDLRRFLRAQEHFLDHSEKVITAVVEPLVAICDGILAELPKLAAPSPFTVPLIHVLHEPLLLVEKLNGTLTNERSYELGIFTDLKEQFYLNLCGSYGLVPSAELKKPLKRISELDMSPRESVDAFCKSTPFHDFLLTPVPLKFDYETRFNHVHVVGGSGAGKTQLLQSLILSDLQSDDPPALILVDSQSDLINKITHLDLFRSGGGKLGKRLTLITPRDIECPPAINIFDIDQGRLSSYDQATREQIVAGVIQTFDYLFAGLLGADLTAKQSVFFRFIARLMLALPETLGRNATILDMMYLMDDPSPYRQAIESLPQIQRSFFERDFGNTGFRQTKEQIRYRLQAILENPTLARLFTSTRTKIDLFTEINNGGVILIDTAKDFLKDASAHFGRIFISLVLQAALERAAIPERKRRAAFLVVDEAADYFDDNIDDLLTQVRKYKVGCLFAHQFLDQCSSSLRSSLAANTATKFCAAISMLDARALAADMRTTPDFIQKQKKLNFACFVRNVTPEAVSIPVEAGILERQPRLSPADYATLRDSNRRKVSTKFDTPAPSLSDNTHDADDDGEEVATTSQPGANIARPKSTPPGTQAKTKPPSGTEATDKSNQQPDPNAPSSEW